MPCTSAKARLLLTLFKVVQNRRNNRKLQINRKGYKPSIRRKKYEYKPGDLVKFENNIYMIGGVFSYGRQVQLRCTKKATKFNKSMQKVHLLKFQRGFAYV